MGKRKVCVYAICKNEAKFVRRWMESMREADWVVVLDTGSDDGTPQMLRELGAQVTEEVISPWRFDVARNRSLELVPEEADICVCTDLDEILRPGWRVALASKLWAFSFILVRATSLAFWIFTIWSIIYFFSSNESSCLSSNG